MKEFASVAFEEALKLVGAGPDCVDAKKIRDQEQFRLGGPPRRDYAFIQAMRQIASLDHLAKWNEIRDWALEQKNEILVAICG